MNAQVAYSIFTQQTKTKQASCHKYELWVSNNNKKQNLKQGEENSMMIIMQKILFD